MPQSPLLSSFDPFATHPFTNNSGLVAQPPQPSQYSAPFPSPRGSSHFPAIPSPKSSTAHAPSSSPSSAPSSSPPLSPQPRRRESDSHYPSSSPARPIFVQFRQETSSPDLVLRKKAVFGQQK